MKRFCAAAMGVVLLGSGAAVRGQSKPATHPGVWRTTEVVIAGPTPRTLAVADRPYFTVIPAKYYSRSEVQSEGPRPVPADVATATADELRAVWGPFVGEAGTYEISGSTITLHPLASKSPAAMAAGAFFVCSFRLEGDTLWISQQRNQNGPYASPVTFRLTRLE